jgi:RNA polymerase sigma factor (TIGR02999 family)
MSDVTRILNAIEQGDRQAAGRLLPLVYDELRKLAAQKLAHEQAGQTLQATALVHEAYLRLVASPLREQGEEPRFEGRGHFFAAAAEAMRRILVDNARRKRRLRRGGDRRRLILEDIEAPAESRCDDLEALSEALDALASEDGPKAELVKLRFFAGLSIEEAAACLGISRATAVRHWAYARAWLYDRLGGAGGTFST